MSTTEATGAPMAFQIAAQDLGPLIVDRLRLTVAPASPLASLLVEYRPASGQASEGLAELDTHGLLGRGLELLAQPDIVLRCRTGGPAVRPERFAVAGSASPARGLAVVLPGPEGATIVHVFDNDLDFAWWWVDTFGSPSECAGPNYLPPPLSLESTACLLHAIDAWRRHQMESALQHAPPDDTVTLDAREFAPSLQAAMASADVRWLLPAFLYLIPELETVTWHPQESDVQVLETHQFLVGARDETRDVDVLRFGEAGLALGIEFERSWVHAVGFGAISARDPRGVLARGFLAATSVTNHWFDLHAEASGVSVNHQPLTATALTARIQGLLEELRLAHEAALALPPASPAVAPQGPAGQGGSTPAFCHRCGSPTRPGARFCGACGTKLID